MKSPAALINRKACSGNRADGAVQAAGGVGVASHWYNTARIADLDNDGLPEIIGADRRGSVAAFHNNGGAFVNTPCFLPAVGHGAMALDVADIDGNGFADIVTVFCGVRADSGYPHLSLENLQPGMRCTIERTAHLDGGWTGVWEFDSGGSATNWTDTGAGPDALHVYRACRREPP